MGQKVEWGRFSDLHSILKGLNRMNLRISETHWPRESSRKTLPG